MKTAAQTAFQNDASAGTPVKPAGPAAGPTAAQAKAVADQPDVGTYPFIDPQNGVIVEAAAAAAGAGPASDAAPAAGAGQLSRRSFIKAAAATVAATAAAASVLGLGASLSACASDTSTGSGSDTSTDSGTSASSDSGTSASASSGTTPTAAPTAETASNFNTVPNSITTVGDTYANLLSALEGETTANAKYAAFAQAASDAGFAQIARLFNCTAAAEQVHIDLEYNVAIGLDSSTQKPTAPSIQTYSTDVNLIIAANGEIYETSDMYTSFIATAIAEGNSDAELVFTRAKLAEAYHAERYLDAYNNIDAPDDDKFYLCPVCGYIHKGEDFTACPICKTIKSKFTAY